ncbi:MAG: hypothetical protein IJ663_02835, partial [Spirochaetales bacterium]|nr:hypothetical protein [Spirochaetales bacterium]
IIIIATVIFFIIVFSFGGGVFCFSLHLKPSSHTDMRRTRLKGQNAPLRALFDGFTPYLR